MRIVPSFLRCIDRRTIWELTLLGALLVPFACPQTSILSPHKLSGGNVEREIFVDADSYRLWYEAYQLYRCGLDELDAVQRSIVNRSFRCDQIIDKYAHTGMPSLSEDECQLVVDVLPKRHARIDEYPAYVEILNACRKRLAGEEGPGSPERR